MSANTCGTFARSAGWVYGLRWCLRLQSAGTRTGTLTVVDERGHAGGELERGGNESGDGLAGSADRLALRGPS